MKGIQGPCHWLKGSLVDVNWRKVVDDVGRQ